MFFLSGGVFGKQTPVKTGFPSDQTMCSTYLLPEKFATAIVLKPLANNFLLSLAVLSVVGEKNTLWGVLTQICEVFS